MILDFLFRALSYIFLLNLAIVPPHFPELNLDGILSKDHFLPSNVSEGELVTLLVTGDILPGRSIRWDFSKTKDPTRAFTRIARITKSADITWVNLEGPLIESCPIILEGVMFCGVPEFSEGLKLAGIDVVNIANNHILNFGYDGQQQTIKTLKDAEFLISGEDLIAYKEIKGTKFAFLGFDTVFKTLDRGYIAKLVRTAKREADVIIVQFHWGQEYSCVPKPAGEDPRSLAKFVIDNGADLVVGNHPHWVQGLEFYNGVPVIYSHGNFVFDQMWSQETKEGVLGKYTFYKNRLIDIEFIPIMIDSPFIPRLAISSEEGSILSNLKCFLGN